MNRRRTAIIISRSDDNPGVAAVARLVEARGARAFRVNTDRYPLDVSVSTRIEGQTTQRTWVTPDGRIDGDDVVSVWHRRFFAGGGLPDLGDLRVPAVDESRRSLYGSIAALNVKQMDRLEDVRRCDHKELQLLRARALGLRVPRTLFSNDQDLVGAFFDDVTVDGGVVITKMQSSFAVIRDGEEHVVYTNVVSEQDRHELDGLRYCPMQFQELVEKRVELRATVVGDEVFCAAVDSQGHSPETRLDWRKDGIGLLKKWKPYPLPPATERALLALVHGFGLQYAAADFIVTPAGELVFLEINAGGEWFWLDAHHDGSPGLPIASAIANWLVVADKR